jgi:hypothetical protein
MRRILIAAITVCRQIAGDAHAAACAEPVAFEAMPDGATATREELLSAQRAIKAYDNAVKAYTDCLHDAGDSPAKANLAVAVLEKTAARFNEELHRFKLRNGGT